MGNEKDTINRLLSDARNATNNSRNTVPELVTNRIDLKKRVDALIVEEARTLKNKNTTLEKTLATFEEELSTLKDKLNEEHRRLETIEKQLRTEQSKRTSFPMLSTEKETIIPPPMPVSHAKDNVDDTWGVLFDDKNLPKEKQKEIIATLKEEKAEFLLESYSSKDGIETWVWNDPDPAKKGNPDYSITYKRLPDGTLNISYGKLASAYLCFEPDESTGRHGTIVGIDNNSMKIHSPNQDNQIIVEKPQQTTWQDKVQNQRENQRITTVSPPSQ